MPVILYERQRQILDFMTQYIQQQGFAPSLKTIAKAMGLSSLATVHEHLQQLERKGVIKTTGRGKGKRIEIVDKKLADVNQGVRLPILGYLSNQAPIEAYDDPNASFYVTPLMASGKKRCFVLEVKGNALVEDAVLGGDLLILEEEAKVNNADLVVALLEDDTAVLKKFFQEETRVKLESIRGRENPVYITKVRIQGRVKAIIRRF